MKILVKIGSALISEGPRVRFPWLAQKVWEIAALARQGHQFVIVSSGAVAAGMEIRRLTSRPSEILELQLLSGIGQVRLMTYYKDLFREWGINVAQVLLTHHNFSSARERETITQIMSHYLSRDTIPVVNENDMVDKEEFDHEKSFSDNDILAALVAINTGVELAIILTDVDGLYAHDPKQQSGQELIREVERVTPEIEAMAGDVGSELGLGGMRSKITAARMLTEASIGTIIASGEHALEGIIDGSVPATRFHRQ